MILYIMRHAEAVEGNDALHDEWRYLTEKGRSSAKKTSALISKLGPKTRLTITSPLTRAVQTAEIMADNACRRNVVIASELLLPGAGCDDLVSYLKNGTEAKRVMLIGHEPQLGSLVASLLDRKGEPVSLKKGACAALELDLDKDAKSARFLWYLVPGRKRVTSLKKAFPM